MYAYNQVETGKRLKQLREEWMQRQKDAGEKATVVSFAKFMVIENSQSVYQYEKGESITLDLLLRYCEKFECEIDYLLCRIDKKTKQVQTISDALGIGEEAAHNLSALAESEGVTLKNVLVHPDIVYLFNTIYMASDVYRPRAKIIIDNYDRKTGTMTEYVGDKTSNQMKKFVAVDTFSGIIQDIADDNDELYRVLEYYTRADNMIDYIDEQLQDAQTKDDEKELHASVATILKRIQETLPESIINNYTVRDCIGPKRHIIGREMKEEFNAVIEKMSEDVHRKRVQKHKHKEYSTIEFKKSYPKYTQKETEQDSATQHKNNKKRRKK